MQIFGIILAGGQGSRMQDGGADKALLSLAGRPLLAHAIARLAPQTAGLALSANGDPARFRGFDVPVLADTVPGYPGPLAGILAGLDWAVAKGAGAVVSVAVDTPFFAHDLVARLAAFPQGALAASATGLHPTFALWPVSLRAALHAALAAGQRKVSAFAAAQGMARVEFAGAPRECGPQPIPGPDPFFNINTAADLEQATLFLLQARA